MDTFYSPKIIAILFNQKSNDAESLASEIKLKLKDDFADVYKELGLLQLKIEKDKKAKKNLQRYLDLAINPKDKSIIESYLN